MRGIHRCHNGVAEETAPHSKPPPRRSHPATARGNALGQRASQETQALKGRTTVGIGSPLLLCWPCKPRALPWAGIGAAPFWASEVGVSHPMRRLELELASLFGPGGKKGSGDMGSAAAGCHDTPCRDCDVIAGSTTRCVVAPLHKRETLPDRSDVGTRRVALLSGRAVWNPRLGVGGTRDAGGPTHLADGSTRGSLPVTGRRDALPEVR